MRQTILFGNGINLLSGKDYSWDNVLAKLTTDNSGILKDTTATHVFEDIVLNNKAQASTNTKYNYDSALIDARKKFQKELNYLRNNKKESTTNIYKRLLELGAENYLTTNYDRIFNDILKGEKWDLIAESKSGNYISTHRKYFYEKEVRKIALWPIHGDTQELSTIMLGFGHYCSSISALAHYFGHGSTRENGYPDKKNTLKDYCKWKEKNKASYIRYKIKNKVFDIFPSFWADLFFSSDVHIIGFGMDQSENDLWMVLNKRKEMLSKGLSIHNKIFYYGEQPPTIELLRAYGVECYCPKRVGDNWEQLYEECLKKMKDNIAKRRVSKQQYMKTK